MLTPSDRERLVHIADAAAKIMATVRGMSRNQFAASWQTQLIIERLLEIIGEAANHLSTDFVTQYTSVPWPQIVAMRNLISHEYFRIDANTVWETAQRSVPPFHRQIEQILNESADNNHEDH